MFFDNARKYIDVLFRTMFEFSGHELEVDQCSLGLDA